jgi:hypothetical protein
MRAVALCGAVLALMSIPCAAPAGQLSKFEVAGWNGGAFTNPAGTQFNHCAASARYNSGIFVSFAVSRSYQWSMAFSHSAWRLTRGQSYPIAFTVDQDTPLRATAVAIGSDQVEVVLADSAQLFNRFRQGQQLRVAAAGQIFTFNLTGTSQVLPVLLRCVQVNLNPQRPAAPASVASNPFAAQAPIAAPPPGAASAAGKGRPAAYRAEAVSLAANFLGAAGVVGFRIVNTDENSPFDAAWTAENIFGVVRIEPTEKPELISAMAIAADAAGCKSKFASGSMPADRNGEGLRAFTKCDGNDGMTVFYAILPRKAGGHYLIGTGALGSEEPARQVESNIRDAAWVVTKR